METILFVDDDVNYLKSLKRMFAVSQNPWSINCVSSAEEALKRIYQGGIDVVVTDLKMPGKDGMMLLTQLRNDQKTESIPVVLLTGKGNEEAAVEAMHAGAADYLVKDSLTLSNLQRAILNSIEKNKLQQRVKEYNRKLKQKVCELRESLALVKQLEGLLPICMFCKKIRDDQDKWQPIEKYIEDNSQAEFTHALCRECQRIHYPGIVPI